MKKNFFIYTIFTVLFYLNLSACAPVVAGAAVGAAGTVVVYDRQSIKSAMQDIDTSNLILTKLKEDELISKKCHIELTVYHGVVLLVGQAPTQELKDRVYEIVDSVSDIKRIYNEVTIEGPTSNLTRTNDTWITAKVKSQLLATKGLKSSQIKVLTENSDVFLMGIVSREQADLAVSATKQVGGVTKVIKVFQYK